MTLPTVPATTLAVSLASKLPATPWRTRFAPAPTGRLHLGHLVNAIFVWGIARAYGGVVVLRIEDHDRARCRPEFESALLDDLAWLGLDGDEAPCASYARHPHAMRQSDNHARYASALAALDAAHLVYACQCTRSDIARATTTRSRDRYDEIVYPGTCRSQAIDPALTHARRVQLPADIEHFDDILLGPQTQQPSAQCGDLLVRDRHGNWTYQFAVTVDDYAQSIDVIIRGADLLASVGRQRMLARMLGREQQPLVLHHPLLVHPDGAKLSKANGDTSIAERRKQGATTAQLLGEAAHRAGLLPTPRPLEVSELASLFR